MCGDNVIFLKKSVCCRGNCDSVPLHETKEYHSTAFGFAPFERVPEITKKKKYGGCCGAVTQVGSGMPAHHK